MTAAADMSDQHVQVQVSGGSIQAMSTSETETSAHRRQARVFGQIYVVIKKAWHQATPLEDGFI